MDKRLHVLLTILVTFCLITAPEGTIQPAVAAETTVITLTIGDPMITVNGSPQKIDATGTTPLIIGGRTLLPIRAVVEAIGGTIDWNAATQTVTITAQTATIRLTIGNRTATVNGTSLPIDPQNAAVVPVIVNGRTMLPVRFIGEQLGGTVDWNATTRTATLTFSAPVPLTAPSLLEPLDGALFTSTTVGFKWSPVDGATSYSVSIKTGDREVYHGTSTTTSLSPSAGVLVTGQYTWTVTAAQGATTGPSSLARQFSVKIPLSPADIVKKVTPAVAEIAVQYADGNRGVAAAFFVSADGVFVTTYGIIKGAVSGSVILSDGTEHTSLRVLGYDPAADLAVLTMAADKPLAVLNVPAADSAQLNQDVVMVGPVIKGIPQYVVTGVINGVLKTGFTVRGAAENAVEGAPILDQFGEVVGMVTTDIRPASGTFPGVGAGAIQSTPRTGDWTLKQVTDREGTGIQALNAPVLGEPIAEATVSTLIPRFRWNTVAGATRYQFWIGEGRNASGNGLFSLFVDSTEVEIYPGNLKSGTTYTWAVRAGNETGWGPWSPDRMFTTVSTIVQPAAPTPLEPLDETVVKAASPMLCWAPVAGADQYYIWIGTPDDDTVYETSSASASVAVPAGTLTSGLSYVWSVRTENSSQVSSLWSPDLSFTMAIPTGVGVPSPVTPAPKAVLTTLNPTFTWQAVPGATRYDLWIDSGSNDAKVYENTVTGTSCTVPAGTLQPGQTYRWAVIAGDAATWSKTGDTWNWSITRQFTIASNAVATIVAPVLLEPVSRATLATPGATLRWTTVTAAGWYRIWVGRGTSPSTAIAVYARAINDPSAGAVQQFVLPAGILEKGATYWWSVAAGNGTDTATSEVSSFTIAP